MRRIKELTRANGLPCVRLYLDGFFHPEDVDVSDLSAWPTGRMTDYHAEISTTMSEREKRLEMRWPTCRVFDNDEDALLCFLSLKD